MLVIGYLLGGGTMETRFQRWLHKGLPGGCFAISANGDELAESASIASVKLRSLAKIAHRGRSGTSCPAMPTLRLHCTRRGQASFAWSSLIYRSLVYLGRTPVTYRFFPIHPHWLGFTCSASALECSPATASAGWCRGALPRGGASPCI